MVSLLSLVLSHVSQLTRLPFHQPQPSPIKRDPIDTIDSFITRDFRDSPDQPKSRPTLAIYLTPALLTSQLIPLKTNKTP